MTVIQGPAPAGPPVSLESSADRDLLSGVNWSEQGVSFTPRGCLPAHLADADCVPCNTDPAADPKYCAHDWPASVSFKPFWVYMAANACPQDGVDYLGQMRQDFTSARSLQIAKALHAGASSNLSLQSTATSISAVGGTASSPSEAMAALLRARGTVGLSGGVFMGPEYVVPRLLSTGLLTLSGGQYVTTMGVPFISDAGFPVSGPGGAPAPAGTAWVYWSPSRPAIAVSGDTLPVDPANQVFWNGKDRTCFTPMVRQRALAVFSTCANFAVLMDVRDCAPCAPVEVPA